VCEYQGGRERERERKREREEGRKGGRERESSVLIKTVPTVLITKRIHILKSLYWHLNERYGLTMVMKWKSNSSTSKRLITNN
jgi:hypothetical protein